MIANLLMSHRSVREQTVQEMDAYEVSIHSLLAPRKIPDSPSQNSLLDF
jgi:hypothetical protein